MIKRDEQLIALLLKPDNLRAALELEQQAKLIREQIAQNFCDHITRSLQEKISKARLTEQWNVRFIKDKYCVEITTIQHNNNVRNYCLRAEYIFTDSNEGWYGWYRPSKVSVAGANLETRSLTEKMRQHGCRGAEGWWVGWKFIREGQKGYVLQDNDQIITCLNDNQSNDHPLATETANEMWQMFKDYRDDIEALEGFKEADRR